MTRKHYNGATGNPCRKGRGSLTGGKKAPPLHHEREWNPSKVVGEKHVVLPAKYLHEDNEKELEIVEQDMSHHYLRLYANQSSSERWEPEGLEDIWRSLRGYNTGDHEDKPKEEETSRCTERAQGRINAPFAVHMGNEGSGAGCKSRLRETIPCCHHGVALTLSRRAQSLCGDVQCRHMVPGTSTSSITSQRYYSKPVYNPESTALSESSLGENEEENVYTSILKGITSEIVHKGAYGDKEIEDIIHSHISRAKKTHKSCEQTPEDQESTAEEGVGAGDEGMNYGYLEILADRLKRELLNEL
eukprot:Nk52_evm7s1705 gene=Nk52_evmTU7s1705